ncbi:Extracellular matrix protein FRAS1 [Takifugu flavidus]|uniref:Extracellular matrix protein FRAS1 n=1 Tax=Takifugu flavidus TaxID=433684 RepID=A0A5C6N0P9_9TELE|nr:Extracellular matrix protein FRAS1 [Takifugu flavidus]
MFPNFFFQSNTTWRPQLCQECSCYDGIAICKPTRCPNPNCDLQKGERLRIPPNECCPECISVSQDSCRYDGAIFGAYGGIGLGLQLDASHDSQWSPSPCTLCICSRGSVACGPRPCPPLSCPAGQSLFAPAGECCPKCGRGGESCAWQGGVYRDGEEWRPGHCSRCVCSDGEVQCSVAACQPVVCEPHENLVIQPGQCCPRCTSNPCLSAGTEHQVTDPQVPIMMLMHVPFKNSVTPSKCGFWTVSSGGRTLVPRVCVTVGQTKVKRAGQCCEECVAAKGSCLYEGTVRYHGDIWNNTGCEFCACSRGQVLCQRAECARLDCPQGSELVYIAGRCCPQCSSPKSSCVFEGKAHEVLISPSMRIRVSSTLRSGEQQRQGSLQTKTAAQTAGKDHQN